MEYIARYSIPIKGSHKESFKRVCGEIYDEDIFRWKVYKILVGKTGELKVVFIQNRLLMKAVLVQYSFTDIIAFG